MSVAGHDGKIEYTGLNGNPNYVTALTSVHTDDNIGSIECIINANLSNCVMSEHIPLISTSSMSTLSVNTHNAYV